jgi:hypothetical protein
VKSGQLRLSALYGGVVETMRVRRAGPSKLRRIATHKPGRINRFAAKQYCALACARVADDNCNREKFAWRKLNREAADFAATGL